MVNNIGLRLRALRERLGITQTELSERMSYARNYISLIENGRKPARRFIQALELIEKTPTPNSGHPGDPFDSTPRGLIKARRKEMGLSLDELAKRTGYQKSAIRNVEEGHTRAGEALLKQLAVHLDLPLEDLMGGSDMPHLTGSGRTFGATANVNTPPGMSVKVIPLLSSAQAGVAQWDDVYEHEGIPAFNIKDPKAVAITIRGDSMEPKYQEGTVAIIYPSIEAKNGDLVIARLSDGSVMFKRLQIDGDKYIFISLNPIYPPRTVEKSMVEKIVPVGMTQSPEML